jgi:hypothetical protein
VERAVNEYLESSPRGGFPFEFGGESSCGKVGDAILDKM